MKLMIFVGKKTSGYFAEEVAKVRGYDFSYIEPKGNIKDQTNDILFATKGSCKFIIFDVDQYINTAEDIAEEVSKISATINAEAIIYAPSFIPGSTLVTALINKDLKKFIASGTATSLKDQLEKNMAGFFEANTRKEIKQAAEIVKEEKNNAKTFRTIGIAGACSRIGNTTQALQLAKYLTLKGYKAAYVELNDNKYDDIDKITQKKKQISFVEKIKAWFEIDKQDEELGYIRTFGVDMFYDQSQISKILKLGYQFYIYDYGCYSNRGFNKTSFVREDLKIFTIGSSSTELDHTKEIAENPFYSDARLIFSFTAENEREELKELMGNIKIDAHIDNSMRTYFAEYTPDPFSFTNLNLYEDLLPLESINEEEISQKKKKRFFGKKPK